MAGSLNKVTLIGNVGADPEIRSTSDGREIANFSLATTESWKDKVTNERKDKTSWHRIVVFSDGLVRVIKNYVRKGSKIFVEGQLQTRKWVDSNNQEHYTTEVVMQNFNATLILLDSKSDNSFSSNVKDNNTNNNNNQNANDSTFDNSELDDEIPF